MVESVVMICDSSPIGKNSAAEAVRLGAGWVALGEMLDCKLILIGDAVYLLAKKSDPTVVGLDANDQVLEIADLSELEIIILDTALADAGLTGDDLVDYKALSVAGWDEITNIIDEADTTFRF